MLAENLRNRRPENRAVQAALIHHPPATCATFFGRLEYKRDWPGKSGLPAQGSEDPGGSNQNRRMAVVPAGVHSALVCGSPVHSTLFKNRQGVHVRSKGDWLAFASGDVPEHACAPGEACSELDARGLKFTLDNFAGPMLVVPEFRVLVKISPNVDEFGQTRFQHRHGTHLTLLVTCEVDAIRGQCDHG